MPLKPHNPKVVEIPGPPVSKELGVVRLQRLSITLDPNGVREPTMEVRWSEGFEMEEGELTKFVAVKNGRHTFTDDDSGIPMKKPLGNTNLLKEIRKAAWGMLHKAEKVPKGDLED